MEHTVGADLRRQLRHHLQPLRRPGPHQRPAVVRRRQIPVRDGFIVVVGISGSIFYSICMFASSSICLFVYWSNSFFVDFFAPMDSLSLFREAAKKKN